MSLGQTRKAMVKNQTECRICRSDLQEVIDFGAKPLANGFDSEFYYWLVLNICGDCGLYQLMHMVPPDTLFKDYRYRSGAGGMQQKMFADLALACGDVTRELVVDIGCNDAALLNEFNKLGAKAVGVDPYSVAAPFDWHRYDKPWSNKVAQQIAVEFGQAKIITCTNTWAHLDDLQDAVFGIRTLLHVDGSFVIQVPWVRDMLMNTLYDTIYHEHLSYFGVKQLRRLFQPHWMDVYHVDYLPDVHGGTIRCWIGHGNDRVDATVEYAERLEQNVPSPTKFAEQIYAHRKVLRACLGDDKWAMYGCSAKGTMLVNLAVLKEYIVEAVDDTLEKQGLQVPGTQVVINGKLTQQNVLLTAWNYANRIKAKLPKGTRVCVPFPIPRVEYV